MLGHCWQEIDRDTSAYLGIELELEGEEDGERHADQVEGHQVGHGRQVLPPAAPRHACQDSLSRVKHNGDHHERRDGRELGRDR